MIANDPIFFFCLFESFKSVLLQNLVQKLRRLRKLHGNVLRIHTGLNSCSPYGNSFQAISNLIPKCIIQQQKCFQILVLFRLYSKTFICYIKKIFAQTFLPMSCILYSSKSFCTKKIVGEKSTVLKKTHN